MQLALSVEATLLLVCPAGQTIHALMLVAPNTAEYRASGHDVQSGELIVSAYFPGEQFSQSKILALLFGRYVLDPAGQLV